MELAAVSALSTTAAATSLDAPRAAEEALQQQLEQFRQRVAQLEQERERHILDVHAMFAATSY